MANLINKQDKRVTKIRTFASIDSYDEYSIGEDKSDLLDFFYPVGSYYETSNTSFDPNEEWGGVWVQDTQGYVTVGSGYTSSYYDIDGVVLATGSTTGQTKYLIEDDMLPQTIVKGAISGYYTRITDQQYALGSSSSSGHYEVVGLTNTPSSSNDYLYVGNEEQTTASGVLSRKQMAYSFGLDAIQPSIGVIRWHRTA